jgi:hypothetical protein
LTIGTGDADQVRIVTRALSFPDVEIITLLGVSQFGESPIALSEQLAEFAMVTPDPTAAFAAVDLHFANFGCHQFSIALRTFHFVVILRLVSTHFCEKQF